MQLLRFEFSCRASDVNSSTFFHVSPSAPTSRCFYIPHACVHFSTSMLLASVHHSDFMAHDVRTSRNLDSELPLGISPPRLYSALDQFHHLDYTHWAGVCIAFCANNCCSWMLTVKISSHCLHRDVISADEFRWFASGMEPSFFTNGIWTAKLVLMRIQIEPP